MGVGERTGEDGYLGKREIRDFLVRACNEGDDVVNYVIVQW